MRSLIHANLKAIHTNPYNHLVYLTTDNRTPKVRTYHNPRRYRVPFQPERDEWRSDQDYSRYEHCREVESSVPGEDEVYLETAVVACESKNHTSIAIIWHILKLMFYISKKIKYISISKKFLPSLYSILKAHNEWVTNCFRPTHF